MAVSMQMAGAEQKAPLQTLQPHWQRVILLIILGYEAAGCLTGGTLLVLAPDGQYMEMPVQLMRGVFPDFLIPGLILFGLGILTSAAFVTVLRHNTNAWLMACLSMGGLIIWFWVEIAIILELVWLHAMWGLPVVAGAIFCIPLIPNWRAHMRRTALFCGVLSSVLYLVINVIVPLHFPGYSHSAHTVSELSAVGAPTRMLWSVLVTPYTFLMLVFGWGVLKSAGENRNIQVSGIAMLAYAALGFFWPFAPMHPREILAAGGGTLSDTMHLALGAVTEILYLTALGFAAVSLGKGFRWYSLMTFIVLLAFGTLTFLDAPKISNGEPTPFIGAWERINIGVFLLWVIVLTSVLWNRGPSSPPTPAQNLP